MSNARFTGRRCARVGWAVGMIVLAAGAPEWAPAAERIVLGEEFMATW